MVLSMDRWIGKTAIVTGASSGIGAAIAEALVEKGLIVAGLARRKDRLDALAQKLSNKKGKFYAVKADLTKEEEILNSFKWVKENLGPVHVLINNAGYLGRTTLVDGDTEVWRNTLNVNVLGLCIATREAIRDMRANNVNGHIVHINSITGHQVFHNFREFNVYTSSKFAVTALAETLRLELIDHNLGIKITSISPGLVDTEILPDSITKQDDLVREKQIIEAENVADSVVYALSTPPHVQVQELIVRSVNESFIIGN